MAGNSEPRSRLLRDVRRFTAIHVSELTVDRQEGDVERKREQPLTETCVHGRVAGVVEPPPAAFDDEADGPSGDVMVCADSRQAEAADRDGLVDVDDLRDDLRPSGLCFTPSGRCSASASWPKLSPT